MALITDGLAGVKYEVREMAPRHESCEARIDINLKGFEDLFMIGESSGVLVYLNVEQFVWQWKQLAPLGSDTNT